MMFAEAESVPNARANQQQEMPAEQAQDVDLCTS
jgi:hypothetical protein